MKKLYLLSLLTFSMIYSMENPDGVPAATQMNRIDDNDEKILISNYTGRQVAIKFNDNTQEITLNPREDRFIPLIKSKGGKFILVTGLPFRREYYTLTHSKTGQIISSKTRGIIIRYKGKYLGNPSWCFCCFCGESRDATYDELKVEIYNQSKK